RPRTPRARAAWTMRPRGRRARGRARRTPVSWDGPTRRAPSSYRLLLRRRVADEHDRLVTELVDVRVHRPGLDVVDRHVRVMRGQGVEIRRRALIDVDRAGLVGEIDLVHLLAGGRVVYPGVVALGVLGPVGAPVHQHVETIITGVEGRGLPAAGLPAGLTLLVGDQAPGLAGLRLVAGDVDREDHAPEVDEEELARGHAECRLVEGGLLDRLVERLGRRPVDLLAILVEGDLQQGSVPAVQDHATVRGRKDVEALRRVEHVQEFAELATLEVDDADAVGRGELIEEQVSAVGRDLGVARLGHGEEPPFRNVDLADLGERLGIVDPDDVVPRAAAVVGPMGVRDVQPLSAGRNRRYR